MEDLLEGLVHRGVVKGGLDKDSQAFDNISLDVHYLLVAYSLQDVLQKVSTVLE